MYRACLKECSSIDETSAKPYTTLRVQMQVAKYIQPHQYLAMPMIRVFSRTLVRSPVSTLPQEHPSVVVAVTSQDRRCMTLAIPHDIRAMLAVGRLKAVTGRQTTTKGLETVAVVKGGIGVDFVAFAVAVGAFEAGDGAACCCRCRK